MAENYDCSIVAVRLVSSPAIRYYVINERDNSKARRIAILWAKKKYGQDFKSLSVTSSGIQENAVRLLIEQGLTIP